MKSFAARLLTSALVLTPSLLKAEPWLVLSREDGCQPISILFRGKTPSSFPASPQEYAATLRRQGQEAEVGPVPEFPPELGEKVLQVRLRDGTGPVFVREEICRSMEAAR